ncbi:MAG: ABC transporter permease, partial [Allorhizobium sp.]
MSYEDIHHGRAYGLDLSPNVATAPRWLSQATAAITPLLGRYGLVIAFLILWQASSKLGWVNASVFPPLDQIIGALWKALSSGAIVDDIAISLQRSGIAFVAAVGLGIPLGLFMGQVRAVERALDPLLQFFRQTSALALYPVFILLLGLGEASK